MGFLFGDSAPRPVPRPPVNKPRSRVGALQEEIDLMTTEDEFEAKKLAGQKRRDRQVEQAFKAAKNAIEFRKAVEGIDPAVSMKDKLALHALRQEYRLKHRKPVQPGEGAAPGTVVVPTEVKVPGVA